jgi:hypothetical protein
MLITALFLAAAHSPAALQPAQTVAEPLNATQDTSMEWPSAEVWPFSADAPIATGAYGEGAKRKGVGPKLEDGKLTVLEPWWKLDTSVGLPSSGDSAARKIAIDFTLEMQVGCEGAGFAWLDTNLFGSEGAPPLPAPSPEWRVAPRSDVPVVAEPNDDASADVNAEDSTDASGAAGDEMSAAEFAAMAFLDRLAFAGGDAHGGWEAPNYAGSLGFGFDARNPWTEEPFRGSGNIHHRPEHEISIHWDGAERFKKTTEIDFRDGEAHKVHIEVEYVPGGAYIDLTLDAEVVFERWFLAGAEAYAGRAAFGGRNAETAGWATVDDLTITRADAFPGGFPEPRVVTAIDHQLNDAGAHETRGTATLPDDLSGYERILLTLRLEEPEKGYDPWDRLAHLYVQDEALGRVELLRYITPYDRGGEWTLDVTDMAPVLTGERTFLQRCETYASGWLVTVELSLYPRPEEWPVGPEPYRVERLWEGKCIVGNPDNPTTNFFVPRTLALDPETLAVNVRTAVTGHGMYPNTDNAAEFMPLDRTLTVGGDAHTTTLWKTDNYLNPIRPQGGTWKYDRAGWAPGDIVPPWQVRATGAALAGDSLEIKYDVAEYLNEGRGQTWEPFHQVASYAVLYRTPNADSK